MTLAFTKQSRKALRPKHRKGASAVEFALIAPLLVLFVFGIVEFGRAIMIQQIITNASREGARHAVIESATEAEVASLVQDYLDGAGLSGTQMECSPSNLGTMLAGDPVTVRIRVPFAQNSLASFFNLQFDLTAETTMQAERME